MVTDPDPGLYDQASNFASRIATLLEGTVAHDAPVVAERRGNRMVVAPLEQGERQPIVLTCDGRPVVDLWLHYFCSWDSYESYLAVDESRVHVCIHQVGEPLLRFEYERGQRGSRAAHVHVHAASTGLGWLSAITGSPRKPQLWSLHLPVGGRRFRTALEDVIEMLVEDLGIQSKDGWEAQLEESREEWLVMQTHAVTRDRPKKAAETLEELGWSVSPPTEQPQ